MAVKVSAEDIIKAILQMGVGAALGGTPASAVLGGMGFGRSSANASEVLSSAKQGTADSIVGRMAATEYPNPQHTVKVNYFPGKPRFNAGVQRGIGDKAARMQTLAEHNEALTKFLRPGQTPEQRQAAIQAGIKAEQELPSYWYDTEPRVMYMPSSSAVKAIRVTPDHRVQVQWGSSPKWYSYSPSGDPQKASEVMKELVLSHSIGQSLCRKSSKPGCGGWARKYFDSSFGT